jgi:hypothetical protein
MNVLERGLLVVAACIMTFDPIDLSLAGLAPIVASLLVVGFHIRRHRGGEAANP